MNEDKSIDVRGLSCPQPVLQTKRLLEGVTAGSVEVLVDSGAPRDNVTRFAQNAGWTVAADSLPDGSLRLTLRK